jgi:hypothetical protein
MLARRERGEAGRPGKNRGDVATISEYRKVLEDTQTDIRDASRLGLLLQPRQPLPGILDFGLARVGVLP